MRRQVFVKLPSIEFNGNPLCSSRVVTRKETDGHTDTTKLIKRILAISLLKLLKIKYFGIIHYKCTKVLLWGLVTGLLTGRPRFIPVAVGIFRRITTLNSLLGGKAAVS